MSMGTGLSSQVGFGQEVTYGTPVTVTRFVEFDNESMTPDVAKLYTRGINQIVQRSGRVRTYIKRHSGSLALDVMNKGMGLFFKHALGTSTIAQVGVTPVYKQTHTLDTITGKRGLGLTMQRGIPSVDGVVNPFTHAGVKIAELALSQGMDANLKMTLTLDAAPTVNTATALAAASYPAASTPFSFIDLVITVGGVSQSVKTFEMAVKWAMDMERRFAGNVRKEPLANGEAVVEGSFSKEFESLAVYNAWIGGTTASLVGTWAVAGTDDQLVITIPVLEYTGGEVGVSSSEVVQQDVPWKALFNGTDPTVKVEIYSTDTAY